MEAKSTSAKRLIGFYRQLADLSGVSSGEREMLLELLRYANEDTLIAFPGEVFLSEKLGRSRTAISRALKLLQEKRLIEKVKGHSTVKSNSYRLLLFTEPEAPPQEPVLPDLPPPVTEELPVPGLVDQEEMDRQTVRRELGIEFLKTHRLTPFMFRVTARRYGFAIEEMDQLYAEIYGANVGD